MKLKKNRKFSYAPRFYKGEGNPYELKHKFDDQRQTVNLPKGIKGKWNAALDDYQGNRNDNANKRVLIIVGVLVLLFLIIIGFDLSIFLPKS
ncbi:riboflavin synthase subunit beta [Winogradskyella sp. UBA3174]|uniref:riboflavin synthase subunit beta n=1 Tax=Winogradskyella sp. UBA3174 TaxID=1947785 RepID=UPI0025F827B1|nr:riboflavin synthase subunit beta [Winogradskyella sp. UBA3174]|tara:strand:- start:67127 stop:67402 length:276 start_codon:yes stop_codon:yes gene_type:complete